MPSFLSVLSLERVCRDSECLGVCLSLCVCVEGGGVGGGGQPLGWVQAESRMMAVQLSKLGRPPLMGFYSI